MRKLLTAGIFGTILGIVGTGTANASIVSSGFLDEKLTEYALSTSLDLKANQTDLTALNDIVGKGGWGLFLDLKVGSFPYSSELFPYAAPDKGMPFKDIVSYIYDNLTNTGAPNLAGVTDKLLNGWTNSENLTRQGLIALNDGWTDKNDGTTYLGVKDLNTKIGNLPSGPIQPSKGLGLLIPGPSSSTYPTSIRNFMTEMYTAGYWGISGLADAVYFGNESMGQKDPALLVKGLRQITDEIGTLPSGNVANSPLADTLNSFIQDTDNPVYPDSLASLIDQIYGGPAHPGILSLILHGYPNTGELPISSQIIGILPAMEIAERAYNSANANAAEIGTVPDGKNLAGMISETDAKIGTLPNGNVVNSPLADDLNRSVQGTDNPVYPDSLAKLIEQIYGNTPEHPGILTSILHGYPIKGQIPINSELIGIFPAMQIAERADSIAKENATKIGTLPSGVFPGFPGHMYLFPSFNQPLTYPTSLAELINAIYGNSETGAYGLLAAIIAGFRNGTDDNAPLIGLIPNYNQVKNVNALAEANATKIGNVPDGKNLAGMIGTLPAGYDSIGAALTAIKGIAEDAKAAALAAIPDPKQEGSSGKFVLTVDIVGDNATYHWEKIDREGETTTTTE